MNDDSYMTAMHQLKLIYSEKATKCSEISTVDLSYVVTVKSTVEISQNVVAFSEYMNFRKVSFSCHTRIQCRVEDTL